MTRFVFAIALTAWLLLVGFCTAGEVAWGDLGDGKAKPKATANPKPTAAVLEECDCGCDPCRCSDITGKCNCGRMMPKAKAQAPKPVPTIPQITYMPQLQPIMQPSPVYWGGVGGGYAGGAACST